VRRRQKAGRQQSLSSNEVGMNPRNNVTANTRRLEPMLLYEAIDPNAKRKSLLQQVDQETVWSR